MILVLLYVFSFYIIALNFNKGDGIKSNKKASLLCFILLFAFFGFRDLPILNDTAHYYDAFQESVDNKPSSVFDINLLGRFGIGYQSFVNFLIRHVSSDPYTIIWFSSLLVSLFFTFGFRRHTSNIGLFCYLMLSSGTLLIFYSAIRQSLAVMFFLIAFSFLQKKKYIWYGSLSLVAFTFHHSAVILFLPVILSFVQFNKKNLIICGLFTIAAIVTMADIIELFGFTESSYLDTDRQRETLPIASFLYILMYLFIFIFCFHVGKKYKIQRPNDMIIWMSICNFLIAVASVPLGIVGRFGMYYSVFMYLMLVYYLDNIPKSYRKHYLTPIATLLIIRMIIELLIKPEWNHLVPYGFYDFFATSHQTDFGY